MERDDNTPARRSVQNVSNESEDSNANNANNAKSEFTTANSSPASLQLSQGILQMYEPPLAKAKGQLKELICKQNKIYIDLSAEKFKLDNAEVIKLQEMKRAINIQTGKQKELQRKLQKQQHEESLIAKK
uniref:Biogenesis of lysosome-related organelles complex 1 subunit 6 n=1 Tax=Glossina morsitans morsitans TaxID=37546 RepID=A0A1B0FI95_GLOMM